MTSSQPSWEALEWADGSLYDGQTEKGLCHGYGVLTHHNGDSYAGAFHSGSMDGSGVYVWKEGTLYRGDWNDNRMEGCGVRMSKQADGEFLVQEGQFVRDNFLGTFMECSISDARISAAAADVAAAKARRFKVPETTLMRKPRKQNWISSFFSQFGKEEKN